jgi:hypothetical protein
LAPLPPAVSWQASVSGSGAVAQGGGNALGERAVQVGGDNSGTILSGTQIVNHYYQAAGSSAPSREEIARQVSGYLRWLQERTQSIELRGIEAGGAAVVVLPLETAYVPLRARPLPRFGEAPSGAARRARPDASARSSSRPAAAAGEPSGQRSRHRPERGPRPRQSSGHHRRAGLRQDDGAAAHGLGAGLFAAHRSSPNRRARASA